MSKYVKIKELKKLGVLNIESLNELDKKKVYAFGVQVGNMPKEQVSEHLTTLKAVLDNIGIDSIIYPISGEIGSLTLYELEKE